MKIWVADQLLHATAPLIHEHLQDGKELSLLWIPAHKGIQGNEIADQAAKKAHSLTQTTRILHDISATKKHIRNKCKEKWRTNLESLLRNKDYYLKTPKIEPHHTSTKRKLEVAIARILTKHTRLRYHMKRLNLEPDASCRWCNHHEETLDHLFLHCVRFLTPRSTLREALKSRKIKDPPTVQLLITGNHHPPEIKAYILRHTKIFLLKTHLIDIL